MESTKTSIVFFGTHNFAVTILQGLLNDPNISVDLVITAPDKPVGRK
jgi:methionyl-tRNA formyltransferase